MTTDNSHKGMKLTEVGWIPEDWECKKLSDELNMPTSTISTNKFLHKYYVGTDNMLADKRGIVEYEGILPYSSAREYRVGDILVSNIRPYLKKIWFADKNAGCSTDVLVFRGKTKSSPRYLFSVLSSDRFFDFVMEAPIGTKMPRGDKSVIVNYQFPIPASPSEQQKISSVISDIDTLISSLSSTIDKKRLVKKGTMQQLLTGKIRLKGYSEEWEKCVLGDIGQFSKGRGISRDQANSGNIPCIRYGEIYTTHNDYIREFTSFISEDIAATSKQLKKGDILFAGSGETKEEIGKAVAFINNTEAYAGGDIIILSPTIECDSRFLGYLLNTEEVVKQKSAMGQGDAVVHIHANDLADVEIQLPSIEEQFDIATVLTTMDNEILSLEAELEKYKQLKKGVMQQLLTGKIRLV